MYSPSTLFSINFISKIEAFLALRRRKEKNAFMSEKISRIKSGNEEITMNVTEGEYRNYFRRGGR